VADLEIDIGTIVIVTGGVRLNRVLAFTSPDDDNFKLWGDHLGEPKWCIVYCLPSEHEVDHLYWSGLAWGHKPIAFTAAELEAQLPRAWAVRQEIR
jgi:hypothetical protein